MPKRDPYAPHRILVATAGGQSALWRLALGVLLALAVTFGLGRSVFAIARLALDEQTYLSFTQALSQADTPLTLLILLLSTGFLGIGTLVAAELLHHRSGVSLLGPLPLLKSQFLRVLVALVGLQLAITLLPPWPYATDLIPGLPLSTWLAFLPLTLVTLLLQTGAEELFFRGYLQSQLAARLPAPAIWMGIPSAFFAAAHYAPGIYGDSAMLVVLWAFLFGLAAADLTARSGSLGPAIALHFVNIFVAVAVTSMQGDMSALALYQLPFGPGDAEMLRAQLPVDLGALAVGWLAARLVLRA